MAVKEAVKEIQFILDSSSRCDRCGSQAYFLIELPSTFDLMFCKHHFDKNSVQLKSIAINIIDESSRLIHDKLKD